MFECDACSANDCTAIMSTKRLQPIDFCQCFVHQSGRAGFLDATKYMLTKKVPADPYADSHEPEYNHIFAGCCASHGNAYVPPSHNGNI